MTATATATTPSDLLRIADLTAMQLNALLDLADDVKNGPTWWTAPRSATAIACLFDRPSTRTRVAFEVLGARWVEVRCAPSNLASAGVPPKLGFVHEATLRDRLELSKGVIEDALVFTLLARDYPTAPARHIETAAFDPTGQKLL